MLVGLTPDEAVTVARFLEGRVRVLRAWQLERKLTRYDDMPPIPGDDFLPGEEADAETACTAASSPMRPLVGAGLVPARSPAHGGSEGGPGQARPLPGPFGPRDFDDLHDGLHRTCISPASPAHPDPSLAMDAAAKMLFDADGKFGVPPGLKLPQPHLLSACISRELHRNMARAMRGAEARDRSHAA